MSQALDTAHGWTVVSNGTVLLEKFSARGNATASELSLTKFSGQFLGANFEGGTKITFETTRDIPYLLEKTGFKLAGLQAAKIFANKQQPPVEGVFDANLSVGGSGNNVQHLFQYATGSATVRSNGGGLLPEAIMSTGLFIAKGPVVQVRDAIGNVMPQADEDESTAYQGPLVVLINRLSASSSEIMAAALRDYGRALIVGDNSFGKGTVQQNRPLARVYDFSGEELGSIHYTIAKFYRITGGSTQLKGVAPDIAFPPQVDDDEVGEASEPYALPWDKIKPTAYKGYLNIDAYVPELTKLHANRIQDNVTFRLIKEEMARYQERKAGKVLPVNLAERQAMKKDDDAFRLRGINERLKAMGRQPVKDPDDLPEDFEFNDALLDEAAAIAGDFADAIAQHTYQAEDTPIFTRFSLSGAQSPAARSELTAEQLRVN